MSGKIIKILKGHKDLVLCVSISSDSKLIISGSFDKTIKIWEIKSGKILKTLTGHNR